MAFFPSYWLTEVGVVLFFVKRNIIEVLQLGSWDATQNSFIVDMCV